MTNPEHLLPCLRQIRDLAYRLRPHGHSGDEDSGQCDEDCSQCLYDQMFTALRHAMDLAASAATPAAADVKAKAVALHEPAVVQEKRDEPAAADEVERVAKALWDNDPVVSASCPWKSVSSHTRVLALNEARAAIAAMNRPADAATTEDMPRGEYEAHVAQFAKANRELRLRAEAAEALMGTEVDRNTLKLMSISSDASYKMAVLERDDARAEVERLRANCAEANRQVHEINQQLRAEVERLRNAASKLHAMFDLGPQPWQYIGLPPGVDVVAAIRELGAALTTVSAPQSDHAATAAAQPSASRPAVSTASSVSADTGAGGPAGARPEISDEGGGSGASTDCTAPDDKATRDRSEDEALARMRLLNALGASAAVGNGILNDFGSLPTETQARYRTIAGEKLAILLSDEYRADLRRVLGAMP